VNSTITLTRLARLDMGWRRGATILSKNGKLKHPFMLIGGIEVNAPNGRYQLRTYNGKLPVYTDIGDDPTDALARFRAEELKLSAKKAAVKRWHSWMRHTKGYSDRTAANYYIALLAFFRYSHRDPKDWIPSATHKMLRSFVSRTPDSYTADVVARLIKASSHHGLLWDFAWKTGLRESELKMVTRTDLHLDVVEPCVAVRELDGLDGIKTGEERNVRLHASLVPHLRAWLQSNPDRYLVFGADGDRQDRKRLRALKRDAKRAGLNCNRCKGCTGKNQECREFTLHRFRRTFCSRMLVAAQGDARLIMTQSGHKDMQSLMRYLAPTSQLSTTLAQAF
jgi:integrase